MKHGLCVIAFAAAILASCNKGPEVDLKNASGNEVTKALRQSGVMTGGAMVEPGLWESKVTVHEMNIPGMPPEFAQKMKQTMAEHQPDASRSCLTPDEVKRPKEDFFGADKSCRYEHFTMGGGKIDIRMQCKQEGFTQDTTMTGSYTPTTYSMDMASEASGGERSGMTMKMHVDARRVGECTEKDG
jgi:hypothetical protein